MKNKFLSILALAAVSSVAGEGVKVNTPVDLAKGALVLTFDDAFTAQWLAAAPIITQHKARVTFFVRGRPNAQQAADLKALRAMGHAIGCHGFGHKKAVDFVAANGIEKYLEAEIAPSVDALTHLGFAPSAFAYPSSQHSDQTDAALLKHFRHLRTGVGTKPGQELKDLNEIFVPAAKVAKAGCLHGSGIDYLDMGGGKRPIGQVFAALDRARARGEVIVLYAHNISTNAPGHYIRPEILGRVLAHAQTIGLPAITYDDLP